MAVKVSFAYNEIISDTQQRRTAQQMTRTVCSTTPPSSPGCKPTTEDTHLQTSLQEIFSDKEISILYKNVENYIQGVYLQLAIKVVSSLTPCT